MTQIAELCCIADNTPELSYKFQRWGRRRNPSLIFRIVYQSVDGNTLLKNKQENNINTTATKEET